MDQGFRIDLASARIPILVVVRIELIRMIVEVRLRLRIHFGSPV